MTSNIESEWTIVGPDSNEMINLPNDPLDDETFLNNRIAYLNKKVDSIVQLFENDDNRTNVICWDFKKQMYDCKEIIRLEQILHEIYELRQMLFNII